MEWNAYFVSLSINSPVHIGYNSISHIEMTRYYVPATNLLGACAAAFNKGGDGCIPENKRCVEDYFRFSNFYISKNGRDALYPNLGMDGNLSYGNEEVPLLDMSTRFISNREAPKFGIQIRNDLEFIVPKNNSSGTQNYLVGYMFVSTGAEKNFPRWLIELRELHIGEETRHGLGRVSLKSLEEIQVPEGETPLFGLEGVRVNWSREEITVIYTQPGPLLGHAVVKRGNLRNIYGVTEAREGRIDLSGRAAGAEAGRGLWVPGTLIIPPETGAVFTVERDGIWCY